MIKATRNGIAGIFSDNDWKSGQPQRYGWQEEGKEGKTLPKEIIQFIERRKAPAKEFEEKIMEVNPNPVMLPVGEPSVEPVKEVKNEPIVQVNKKTKKNDNPKQKRRTPGKHKPGTVEKA
jgi:hypothetical protein